MRVEMIKIQLNLLLEIFKAKVVDDMHVTDGKPERRPLPTGKGNRRALQVLTVCILLLIRLMGD